MMQSLSYRNALVAAVFFHIFLASLLFIEANSQRPVMTLEAKNNPSLAQPLSAPPIVKAVSVNSQELLDTVQHLKEERANLLKAEHLRQQKLDQQMEMARKLRVQEQQRLVKLKEDTEKLAIAHKKQIEEEQERLKKIAQQKAQEAKQLQKLQEQKQQLLKKQLEETQKLADLKKKQQEEQLKADKLKEVQVREAQARAEKLKSEQAEKQHQLAVEQASRDQAKKAQLAGEINKYKAMIVNAISRQWILPENADSGLSCQFRIRLAPDGAVLDLSLIRSSGDAILDRSAATAIRKAAPLPVPTDVETFNIFRDISLTVRPENVRG